MIPDLVFLLRCFAAARFAVQFLQCRIIADRNFFLASISNGVTITYLSLIEEGRSRSKSPLFSSRGERGLLCFCKCHGSYLLNTVNYFAPGETRTHLLVLK
jgi:hypothetical protein